MEKDEGADAWFWGDPTPIAPKCRHDFIPTGQRVRLPAFGSYSLVNKKPDGTVEYRVFQCRLCGVKDEEEVPYSFRRS